MESSEFVGGEATRCALSAFKQGNRISADEAYRIIRAGQRQRPFWERLSRYVVERCGNASDGDAKSCALAARDFLKQRGAEKGFGPKWNKVVDTWTDFPLRDDGPSRSPCSITPENTFKLCLALDLTLSEARSFVWDKLYQDWFSFRSLEEVVYQYFIAHQKDFKDAAYARAVSFIDKFKTNEVCQSSIADEGDNTFGLAIATATHMTKRIQDEFLSFSDAINDEAGLRSFERFMRVNAPLFNDIRRTSQGYYQTFVGADTSNVDEISSLKSYYNKMHEFYNHQPMWPSNNKGNALFDSTYIWEHPTSIFPLEALKTRADWRKKLGSAANFYDPIPRHLFHTDRKELKKGVPRGNLITIFFLKFCAQKSFSSPNEGGKLLPPVHVGKRQRELFQEFYKEVEYMLTECCMIPLHPLNPFDALFLQTVAHAPDLAESRFCRSYYEAQVGYLNNLLEQFYQL